MFSLQSVSIPLILAITIVVVAVTYIFVINNLKKTNQSHETGLSTKYKSLKLIKKTEYNHNTIIFRFALPSISSKMGLSIGSHVMLKYKLDDNEFGVARPYTPITNDFDVTNRGYFELMIKIYPHGKMTQYLKNLKVGHTMQIKKYTGKLNYKSDGHFCIRNIGDIESIKKIGMIAGGAGITPLLQLIRYVIHCKHNVAINLLFANKTVGDILLRDELETIHRDHSNKINVHFTVSGLDDKDRKTWNGDVGRINGDMLSKYTFEASPDVMMLLCGPKPMTQSMVSILTQIGHQDNRLFTF